MRQYNDFNLPSKGLALITVLVFLQIFALLTLYAISSNVWEIKMTEQNLAKYHLDEIAKKCLESVESNLNQSIPFCKIPIISSAKLLREPIEWWQSFGCSGNFDKFHYYYIVEFMGTDSCAYLTHANNSYDAAEYYRITLMLIDPQHVLTKEILQSTYILPGSNTGICSALKHEVKQGRQFRIAIF